MPVTTTMNPTSAMPISHYCYIIPPHMLRSIVHSQEASQTPVMWQRRPSAKLQQSAKLGYRLKPASPLVNPTDDHKELSRAMSFRQSSSQIVLPKNPRSGPRSTWLVCPRSKKRKCYQPLQKLVRDPCTSLESCMTRNSQALSTAKNCSSKITCRIILIHMPCKSTTTSAVLSNYTARSSTATASTTTA